MNDKQVVVLKPTVFFFKFAAVYGLLADCFHLEGGTLLCSVQLHRANLRHSAVGTLAKSSSEMSERFCPCRILPFESVSLGKMLSSLA